MVNGGKSHELFAITLAFLWSMVAKQWPTMVKNKDMVECGERLIVDGQQWILVASTDGH